MEIRLVELKDKEGVLKLLDELGEEVNRKIGYSEHNKEAEQLGGPIFEEIVSRKDTFIFIASVNGEIVGLITLYFLPNMRHGWHRGHIEDFIVSEKVRGQGIGTKLFETVKKYCKDNKVQKYLTSGIILP